MSRRTRIKICGITNRADAETAIALGADALGFNTWRGSKRFLDLAEASAWIRELNPLPVNVAVMVNPTIEEADRAIALPWIDALQFHGDEDVEFCAHFASREIPFIKAIALKKSSSLAENLAGFHTHSVLLDAFVSGEFGGTGKLLDLDLARLAIGSNPNLHIWISGGLTPQNVGEIVKTLRPYAVDVASGVEASPGKKDAEKMRAFIEAVREADRG